MMVYELREQLRLLDADIVFYRRFRASTACTPNASNAANFLLRP